MIKQPPNHQQKGDYMMSESATITSIHTGDADVRERLRAAMTRDKTLTQALIAREVGVSPAVVNQYLKGVYAGDNDGVENKLVLWLSSHDERRAQGAAMPTAPMWVETATGARILGALGYAQQAGDIAIIYGGAGLGKTSAIRQYDTLALNVWHVTMTPASASVVTALEEICAALGVNEFGGAAKLFRAVVRKVRGTGGLLVIDEAQHLSVAALDQIRSIHDATEIGVALVGNTEVYARMTGGNRAAYLDRLYSRIGKRLALRQSTKEDIAAILKAWGIGDAKCRATLEEIARKPGALRGLTKVLRLAAMHAHAERVDLCCEHVGRAWRELGGAE